MSPRKSFLSTIFFWNGIINPKKKNWCFNKDFSIYDQQVLEGAIFFCGP